jgi:hypothetical protein
MKLPEHMRNAVSDYEWNTARDWWRDFSPDCPDDEYEIQSLALLIKRVREDAKKEE